MTEESGRKMISLVVPCYNEEEVLRLFYREAAKTADSLDDHDIEMIFVNDGSTDGTAEIMKEIAAGDSRVTYISFSRNFGKEAAMYAGLMNARGDYTAVIDADLQDPPSLLPQMIDILETQDYDCVATRRVTRKGEPKIRSFFARRFYKIINRISDADIMDGARDFRLMKRDMTDAVIAMTEHDRFSKGIFGWVGFRTCWLPYENRERAAGTTKWSFTKLLRYALSGIFDFSDSPLKPAKWIGGALTSISAVVLMISAVMSAVSHRIFLTPETLLCFILLIGGMELIQTGLLGEYTARIFADVKKRPHYIIAETNRKDIRMIG